jgi:hypothetical protein
MNKAKMMRILLPQLPQQKEEEEGESSSFSFADHHDKEH